MVAEAGFDPPTYGLWAQHAIHCATPLPSMLVHTTIIQFIECDSKLCGCPYRRITCADCSSITQFEFRPLRGPMRCLFPRPPGTIRQKKVVVLEVVCSCLMAGSSPASHLFGLWDCTLDCHERRVCSCRITAVKFVCCSDNRWRPQLFTIQPSTADLLAMKNRIKWDGNVHTTVGGCSRPIL